MTQQPAAAPAAPQPAPAAPAEPHEMPFGQVLTVFWRGRWIILLCTVLGAIGGWFYVEQRGTIWRAEAKVYVEKTGSTLGPDSLLFGVGAKNYANTQARVMGSSSVVRPALDKFLADLQTAHLQTQLFPEDEVPPIWLMKNLSVTVGRDDDIITVALDSPHKVDACEIVNLIVNEYQQFQALKQEDSAKEILALLEKDRAARVGEYKRAVQEQTDFRTNNFGVGADSGGLSVLQETWRSLSIELAKAENELLAAEAAWNTAKNLEGSPAMLRQILPQLSLGISSNSIIYPPDAQAMMHEILRLQRDRADLLVNLQPDHPRVETLDEAIADLRRVMADQDRQFARTFVSSLEETFKSAKAKRDELAKAVTEKENRLQQLDGLETTYRALVAQVESAKEAVDAVNERLQLINVGDTPENNGNKEGQADPTFVTVLQHADPETAIISSGKPLRLAAAILLGLFAGCGLAWLRGLLDQRIRTAEEVRRAVELPVLAIMPRAPKAARGDERTAVARWDASTHYAEAARSLRTAVYFGMAEDDGKIVQVTSPDAADGKTTIASNLAIAMAKAGQRTLLIDADLRKPQQAAQFGFDNDRGLADLLVPSEHSFPAAMHRTEIPELHVLASGSVPQNPTEILNSERFDQLLTELSDLYDRIIVDSPPVLPVADARIIATKCSTTILTLRVDKSTRKRASAARDLLVGVGASVLGIALNDMPHGIGYGYGAGYGYYGRYGRYGYGGYIQPRENGGSRSTTRTRRRKMQKEA